MSRCFPFPSWDLSRNDASQVGSIKKLYYESGNAKHSNEKIKENKENKKENSWEKKEKNKKRSRQQDKLDYSLHKKKKLRHDQGSELFESFRDWEKDSFDQRERSGVTEEQGLPSSVPNPCNSLESTQNSSRKNKLLVAEMKRKDQGLILRIKVPLMKHKEPMNANTSTVMCSSGEAVAVTERDVTAPISSGKASCLKQKLLSTPLSEDPCFSGRVTEEAAHLIEAVAVTDFISSGGGDDGGNHCMLEMEKCFSDLILNWNPSTSQLFGLNPCSQDWLFVPPPPSQSPPQGSHNAMGCKASKPDHSLGLISANPLQHQSRYLPEFDIYQLPYVIPF